jgi:hypothetical protein
MAGKPAFDKSSDFAKATPDKSAGKFWFGRGKKRGVGRKTGCPHYS